MAQHGHQRDDARAASREQHPPSGGRFPDEVAANRAAQLELIAGAELVDQVRRDLTVVETLDGQCQGLVLGRRGDRIAALCLVAVLVRQPYIDVLAGLVTGPRRGAQHDALDPRRLLDRGDDLGELPAQSPAYRCSSHGSP
jgi:hypothetical protein